MQTPCGLFPISLPIPASVVDAKGIAVTGLKLEDFELRVDGQLKAISDMTRTPTNVRLAMLFDIAVV